MRAAERDKLLLTLAITSGSSDGWSYMGLGHAFVANMTGNTVLLGIATFGERLNLLPPLISLVCYAAGVAIGSLVTRKVKQSSIWSKSISLVLFFEFLLLVAAEATWIRSGGRPNPMTKALLLGDVATAIGLQSGAMLPLKLPGIITTYITGTWTTLVSGLVLMGSGQERVHGNQAAFEDRLIIQIVFLVIYFLSAVATGWIFRYKPELVGVITSTPILVVVAYGALRN